MSPIGADYFSKTIEKGLRILNLWDRDHLALSMNDISKAAGINLTSTYRFVNTYLELGYLRRDPRTKLVTLGPMAVSLGKRLLEGLDLNQIIIPLVDSAYHQYGISIDVALCHEDTLFVAYRREAEHTLVYPQPLRIKELHCTALGKAFLSSLPGEELKKILGGSDFEKRTENTITKRPQLLTDLARIRRRGYSLNNEEYVIGLIAIGAPLVDSDTRRIFGAVCFNSNTIQHSITDLEKEYGKIIKRLAKDISESIPSVNLGVRSERTELYSSFLNETLQYKR